MNWIRGGTYFLTTDQFNISMVRASDGKTRIYELWNKKTKECLGMVRAAGDLAERQAVQHLKDLAEAS